MSLMATVTKCKSAYLVSGMCIVYVIIMVTAIVTAGDWHIELYLKLANWWFG